MKKNFQYDYANLSESVESLYDTKSREIKANKTILILKNYLKDVSNLKLLDIGCSTGIMTKEYAKHFSEVTGVDIDSQAIKYASRKYKFDNLIFKETPIEENTFNDQIFDVITCSHIYDKRLSASNNSINYGCLMVVPRPRTLRTFETILKCDMSAVF